MKKFIASVNVLIEADNIEAAEKLMINVLDNTKDIEVFSITETREADDNREMDRALIDSLAFKPEGPDMSNLDPVIAGIMMPFFNPTIFHPSHNVTEPWENPFEELAPAPAATDKPEERNNVFSTLPQTIQTTKTVHGKEVYHEAIVDDRAITWKCSNDPIWLARYSSDPLYSHQTDRNGYIWALDFITGIAVNTGVNCK